MSAGDPKGVKHPERSFGVSVGSVLLVIGAALLWRGRPGRAEIVAGLGAALLVLGLLAPSWLAVPSRIWWKFALLLGWVNARVLLTLAYAVLLMPLGAWWRLSGHDPLDRRRRKASRWSAYPLRFGDTQHYKRMY